MNYQDGIDAVFDKASRNIFDDFRVYNRVLTDAEIMALHQMGTVSAITGTPTAYGNPQVILRYNAKTCSSSPDGCTNVTPEITTTLSDSDTGLHFTFRIDESPYSWQEAHDEAIANGNRIPTKEEMQDYLTKNGRFNSVDQWAAVTASNTFGADWIQIGQHDNLPLGASLVDIGHSVLGDYNPKTFWNDETMNTFSYQSIYVEVKSLIPTPTAVAGHDKERYLVFDDTVTTYTVAFPSATTGEALLVSSSTYTYVPTLALPAGPYTVIVGARESVWKKGAAGSTCDETCALVNLECDGYGQSLINDATKVGDAFALAGYTCQSYGASGLGYPGTPFSTGRASDDCYFFSPNTDGGSGHDGLSFSSCSANAIASHAPLCKCV